MVNLTLDLLDLFGWPNSDEVIVGASRSRFFLGVSPLLGGAIRAKIFLSILEGNEKDVSSGSRNSFSFLNHSYNTNWHKTMITNIVPTHVKMKFLEGLVGLFQPQMMKYRVFHKY